MRGADQPQSLVCGYVSIEDRIPADHPLRTMLLQALYTIRSERQ
jgi:hypothetical protein